MIRVRYVDVLRVVSCLAVVTLHMNIIFWSRPQGRLWVSSNLLECLCYFAVPVFLMLSGLTLMDFRNRYGVAVYARKRVLRTLVPFVFWSIAMYYIARGIQGIPAEPNFGDVLIGAWNCKYNPHYWFFWKLFACYLCIPVFGLLQNRVRVFAYLTGFAFVTLSIVPIFCALFHLQLSLGPNPIVGDMLIFPLLGYLLGTIEFQKRQRIVIYALGLLGFCVHYFGTLLYSPLDQVSMVFKGYVNFPSVLYASAVFVWIRYVDWSITIRNRVISMFVDRMGEASLGVYLLHFPVIWVLNRMGVDGSSIFYRTVGSLAVAMGVATVVCLFRRVPLIRHLLP